MSDILEEIWKRVDKVYNSSRCGNPDHILLSKAGDEIERLRSKIVALEHASGLTKVGQQRVKIGLTETDGTECTKEF